MSISITPIAKWLAENPERDADVGEALTFTVTLVSVANDPAKAEIAGVIITEHALEGLRVLVGAATQILRTDGPVPRAHLAVANNNNEPNKAKAA